MKKSYAIWISVIAVLQGGYMLFDGIHKLTTGSYFGPRVGPWAHVVSAFGISADSMAPVFIVIGALWLAGAASQLLGARWARVLLTVLAIFTLAYLVFGTILSLITLLLVLTGKNNRADLKPNR